MKPLPQMDSDYLRTRQRGYAGQVHRVKHKDGMVERRRKIQEEVAKCRQLIEADRVTRITERQRR